MIVLNMIARNAAGTVIDALDSVREAVDFYVIGFAGQSNDATREVVTDWLEANAPARFVVDEFEFVNFADARNRVLAMTPQEFRDDPNGWMLWLDTDDTVLGADELRGILDKMPSDVGAVQFPYVYQTDENGNPLVVHDRERAVRFTLGWYWWRPFHETLRTETPHRIARMDNLTWVHKWEVNRDTRSDRNLALMLDFLRENPDDARTKLYIGHSHYSNERWQEALEWFAEYYHAPENELEKWQAAVFAGDCAFQMKEFELSIGWYIQAIDARPEIADPYIGIASCYSNQGDFQKALAWFKMADDKAMPPSQLFVLPGRYTFNRWCYEHAALADQGYLEQAIEVCDKALKYTRGKHLGFLYYSNGYKEQLDRLRSIGALEHLVRHLQNRGDAINAYEILKFAPKSVLDAPGFEALQDRAYRAIEHLYDPSCDIYSGEECWAGSSDGPYETQPELMARIQAVFDVLARHARRKAAEKMRLTVVDIGCGDGSVAIRLAEKFDYRVTGIDTNAANIERARKRAEERGVAEKVRFIVGDARSLDMNAVGAHDVALVLEVIEHVADPAALVGTAFDLADTVVVSTPHQQVGDELSNTPDGVHLHHVREFNFEMMMSLAGMLGANVETLTTAYAEPLSTALPGYGQWIFELNHNPPSKMPVVFYVGAALEAWTPEQVDGEGIGGSETAVVQMARLFRKAGHVVFVYGPTDGVWDGVFYRHFKHFRPDGPAAGAGALLFVSSRVPEVFDAKVNAAVKWLWCHDATYTFGGVDRLNAERAEEIDAILVLSEWQKRHFAEKYPFSADKLLVTANGIDPGRFCGLDGIERRPRRFVWSSSFDRGLERVLAMWPKIRERWDDAELHVYYGMDTADAMYGTANKGWNELRARLVEGFGQEGVVYHGRTPQNELAKELAAASYWLYPTSFTETYCITALEMQAAGVFPVTSNVGALPERMLEGWPCLVGDDDLFIERIEELESVDSEPQEMTREVMREHALRFTWEKVWKQWKKEIDTFVKANIKKRQAELAQEKADGNHVPDSAAAASASDGRRG